MPRSAIFRAALLLVLLLVAGPALQAEPTRAEAERASSASAAQVAWDLVTQAWNYLVGIWSTNGCGLDPSGSCQPRPITTNADNGCGLDPSGRPCGN